MLFSVEGRVLGDVRVIEIEGGSATVEVPVNVESEPDFYVSAAFLKDNSLYQGTKAIKVPAADRQLSLDLKGTKPQFQPGETASYTLTALDNTGKPVAG